jgi:tetratricopeptide (TPR) repeat protein
LTEIDPAIAPAIAKTLSEARQAYDAGHHDAARAGLDAVLTEYPFRPELIELRLRMAQFMDDRIGALGWARRLQMIDPGSVTGAVLLSRSLVALDRLEDAWDVLADALMARPGALPLLANLARRVSDAEGLEAFHGLWSAGAHNATARAARVRPLVTACIKAGDHARAIAALREAIATVDGAKTTAPRDRTLGADGGRALVDVRDRLTAQGVPHFLAAGTVLGLVREGGLLAFDNDIDIGIDHADFDRETLVSMFDADPRFRVQETHRATPKIALEHWNGVSIDLFDFQHDEGQVWHGGAFTRWWNTPFGLAPIEAYGRTFQIPDPADLYLQECYGDWRTPRPDFDAFYEGPNAVIGHADDFDVYLHRRVFDLICRGDADAVRRYREHFPQTFAWLTSEMSS